MSRIQDKFSELKAKNQKALIAYAMAGYPSDKETISIVRGLVNGGADIIEIGLPFSDPLADGPVIQNASFKALQKGMNFERFLNIVQKIRKETDIPLVLMTYANILYNKGYDKFIPIIKKAGIDGIILPDMSMEESAQYLKVIHKNNMDAIFLISPNTSEDRIRKIASISSGFVYLVSVYGTTGGTQQQFQQYTLDAIKNAKKILGKKLPLGVGFGVNNAEQARSILQAGADAIIVASAFLRLVDKIPQIKIQSKIASFAKSLKKTTILE
ncbi:MAG TPA: tryptophan synthase subunit alpha [Candidatus Nitrosotalea sp.]|nr:tryptophan synthase subunit alpha [Nitrososphaerota archaeon]HKU32512.1 tryptophan synthase subunit alpha [Candidatus Nitrosotalea sp.]